MSVLFVCLGNICRSPMAEGALRAATAKAGLTIDIDSAGTADYHIGQPPDRRAIATAARHGVDIWDLRGRQLSEGDFDRFTHIFAMDKANLAGIKARAPRESRGRIALLCDVFEGRDGEAVPDPYHGDEAAFEAVWKTVDEAAQTIVKQLRT
ncbi:low molecular weight protein-tyrosine-phosphatase [Erythrobacter sp.]|uniref:low molecular weight protein-tyrosine-phosphatase n=1 Tax=Erythrobacter sp. TaxID=1042 RepID=UPI002ECE0835|nr:low molecular weight protein-tyrosine-phosphatase [Erythrobacter sp.]